jgi:hypothetical protein
MVILVGCTSARATEVYKAEFFYFSSLWNSISEAALIVAVSGGVLLALALLLFLIQGKKSKDALGSPVNTQLSNNQTSDMGTVSLSEKLRDLEKAKADGLILRKSITS